MQALIALLAPALVALGFYNHLHRDNLSTRKLFFSYGVFALFINLCSYMVVELVMNRPVSFEGKSFIFYLILSAVFSFILPFVVNLIEQSVSIEVKHNDNKPKR